MTLGPYLGQCNSGGKCGAQFAKIHMSDHTFRPFDADLASLRTMVSQMGGLVENQLKRAIKSLTSRNNATTDEVLAADDRVDAFEHQIEEKAIATIARRQPVARDLRELMVAIRISWDLERIGDLAKNTAKRARAVSEAAPRKMNSGFVRLGRLAQEELENILDAYAQGDAEKAMAVWRSDEDLDALYTSIFRELLTYMMEDPRNIGLCTHMLFGARNMERIGDHATNIAEHVYYLVNGHNIAEERPKKDHTSITKFKIM